MKKSILPILMLLSCGCGAVRSDYSYQKGKEAFWNGAYEEAIANLNRAIQHDPTSSRNYQQLALTYEKLGDLHRAWEHARSAYALARTSDQSRHLFVHIYSELSKQNHFDLGRPSAQAVVEMLGVADTYLHDDKGDLKALYYGPLCLHIVDGKLGSSEWLPK
jgi:tetratricopeptide (TPR) repeat protein